MPLFMVASGFLFAFHANISTLPEYLQFIKKKSKRLIVPYVVISLLILFAKLVAEKMGPLEYPVTRNFWWYILFNPQGGYATFLWFIYTLFVIFLIYPVLTNLLRNKLILTIIIALVHLIPGTRYFCLDLVFKYLIYFHIGALIASNGAIIFKNFKNINYTLIPGLLMVLILSWQWDNPIVFTGLNSDLLALLVALLGIMTFWMASHNFKNIFLANNLKRLGKFSASIYLLHTISMGPVKLFLTDFYQQNYYSFLITAFLTTLAGIILPILITKYIIDPSPLLSRFILGVNRNYVKAG